MILVDGEVLVADSKLFKDRDSLLEIKLRYKKVCRVGRRLYKYDEGQELSLSIPVIESWLIVTLNANAIKEP